MYSLPLASQTWPARPSAITTSCATLPKVPPGSTRRAVATSSLSASARVCSDMSHLLLRRASPATLPRRRRRRQLGSALRSEGLGATILEPELSGRGFEPMPEAHGKAAGDRELVGGAVVDLPDVDGDVSDGGGRRICDLEGARMEVDGNALGQHVAHARAGDAQE